MTDVAQELTSLQGIADSALGTVETALKAEVVAEQLPLIGTAINANFDGTKTLLATQSMKQAVDDGFSLAQSILGSNPSDDLGTLIATSINTELGTLGFTENVQASVDGSGNITLALDGSKTVSDTVALETNLGISNLELKTTGTATASLGYTYNLALGLNAADGSVFVDAGGSPLLSVSASIAAPTLSANAVFGYLNFDATDAGSNLHANFALNLNGSGPISAADLPSSITPSLTVSAAADFNVSFFLATAAGQQSTDFPNISANLDAQWSNNGAPASVTINNVAYSIGSFIQNLLIPILGTIDPIVKPLQQVLAIFNTNITPIANFPGALKLLDVAGASTNWGGDKGDGKFTLLDVIKLAADAAGQNVNLVPFENFLNLLQNLITWDSFLQGKNFGDQSYTVGSFNIPTTGLPTLISGTQQNLNSFLASLPGGGATSNGQTAVQILQSMFASNSSFSFPIFTNPTDAIDLLLGKTADLFQLNLQPTLSFGPGFNPDGTPKGPPVTVAEIPLFGIPFLNALMQGNFQAALNIGFGYDTHGLQEYQQSVQAGTPNPGDFINGLFITDNINGSIDPLVSLTALGRIALSVGVPGLEGSVGGYLEGSLNLDLNAALGTDHKLYADQIAAALASNPFQMFTTSGKVSAGFDAELTIPFFGSHSYDPSQVLLNLSPSTVGSALPSAWTTSTGTTIGATPLTIGSASIANRANIGDTLTLSGGAPSDTATVTYQWERSQFGVITDIAGATRTTYQVTQADLGSDIDVVVTATRASDGSVVSARSNADEPNLATFSTSNAGELDVTIPDGRVTYGFSSDGIGGVIVEAFDQSQDYANVQSLVITGGSTGDQTVVMDQALTIPTAISDSGSANLFVFAASNDVIVDSGTGTLTVSAAANDILQGGAGTNYLNGEAGNDTLLGGSGLNLFQAGPNDAITGGTGSNNVSYALSQHSVSVDLSGAIPVVHGGDAEGDTFTNIGTITEFQGSNFGDTFKAGSQGMIFAGGTGNDTLIGGSGDDVLEGGGGSNMLTGGGGSDAFVFDVNSLASSQAAIAAYDTITDYNAENDEILASGILGPAAAAGTPATSLVRAIEDESGTFAILQVNPNASSGSGGWTTIAHVDGLAVGDNARVLLTGASPVSVPVQVEQLLYVAAAEVNGTPTFQLMIQQGSGADHVLKTLGVDNFNGDSRDYATQFLQIGNQFYFAADIGSSGNELWTSDGTAAGTHLVQDINPGSSPSYPSDFFDYNGKLVFVADDGTDGKQVWITDGTTTTVLTSISGGIQDTPQFDVLNGTLYFTATDNLQESFGQTHEQIYRSDGTINGTVNVLANVQFIGGTTGDVSANYIVDSSPFIQGGGFPAIALGSNLVFPVVTSTDGTTNLFVTGPGVTFSQTTNDTYQAGLGSIVSDPVLMGGSVFVVAAGNEGDASLLVSNGTSWYDDYTNGRPLPSVNLLTSDENGEGDPVIGGNTYSISNLTPDDVTKELFFTASDTILVSGNIFNSPVFTGEGTELWITDGTVVGTHQIADLNTQPVDPNVSPGFDANANQGSNPKHLTVTSDGTLYFSADDGTDGEALYKYTDAGGIAQLQTFDQNASNHNTADNVAGFNANDPSDAAVKFFVVQNRIYFIGKDNSGYQQLWTSNGVQATQLTNVNYGLDITNLASDGIYVSFDARSPGGGSTDVWRTDGTAAGTTIASVITTSGFVFSTGQFAVILSNTNYKFVNQAPSSTDSTVTLSAFGSYQFRTSDFGFSDPDQNNLKAVEVTTLPGSGTLTDNGVAVTAGEFVSLADIKGQKFVYTPAVPQADTSFTFQVEDDGGHANGGIDVSPAPNTLTLQGDAAPQLHNVEQTVSYAAGTPLTISPNLTVTDANDTMLSQGTVSIYGLIDGDVLAAVTTGTNISASYSADATFGFGNLSLYGVDTLAVYQQVLDSVTYSFSGADPTAGGTAPNRFIDWSVLDPAFVSNADIQTKIVFSSQGQNLVPVAHADTGAVTAHQTLTKTGAAGVLVNDTDADGDTLTVSAVKGVAGNVGQAVTGTLGTLTLYSDGSYSYLANNVGGLAPGASATDVFAYTASDGRGGTSSSSLTITVTAPVNHAPVVSATSSNFVATHNQNIAVSSLFSVTDADGDTITSYQFFDATTDPTSGHWVVGGAAQGTNVPIPVTAAQLASATFQAGSGADDVFVQASDGTAFGAWTEFHITAPLDRAPVVSASNVTAVHGHASVAASNLFTVTDADGDTITTYALYDATGSGHFVVNGVTQGTAVEIDLTAAQLASTAYQFGAATDQLYVRANDGTLWGSWQPFTANPFADHAPVTSASNETAVHGQASAAASSLFTVTDADGDTMTTYAFYDATGNGHFAVNGVTQGTAVEIDLTAAQLASTAYQFGAATDQLYVRANDGALWGNWEPFTASPFADHAPVVSAANVTAVHGQASAAASNLFTVSDADGDTMTTYAFYDATGNGHFVVNGAAQGTAVEIDLTAAQLASTAYQFGAATDQLYVRANDGTQWSTWQPFTVTAPADHAPVVSASNVTAVHGQASAAVSNLFTVTDADGDTITTYAVYDATGSGYFVVGGVTQGTAVEIDMTAAQLASTAYQFGAAKDQLYVRANDGALWGNWQPFTASPFADHAPVVSAANLAATHNQSFAASNLFSVTDADGDTMATYALYDATGSGHFVVNGVVQGTAVEIDLTAAQLAQTVYQSGSGTDQLYARANDGALWSSWQPFTVTAPLNQAPVVSATTAAVATGHSLAASSLFTASDPNGDTIATYALYDATGSGHFAVNGVTQGTAVEIDLTAAQLAQTTYVAGSVTDQLYARANDGTLWSSWQPFTAGPVPPLVTVPALVAGANDPVAAGHSVVASSLFTASDPDGGTITTYALYDATGSGHFVVNGVTKLSGTEIDLTAAQLAQTTYVAGSGTDQLYARANDGVAWSAWQPFTAGPVPPVVTAGSTAIASGHSVAASSLFTASDPDGGTITTYAFYDATGSGHFVVNGVTKLSGTEIDLTAAQLAQTTYVAGSGTDQLYARANDGVAWSSWQPFTAGPVPPQVTASNLTTVPGQTLAASNLFTASDPDGGSLTTYAFYDATGNGHFALNGVTQASGTEIDLTAAQLATTTYVAGAGTDQLYVRANDGVAWSSWQAFTATGETPAIVNPGATLELAGAYAAQVTFFGSTGSLKLDNPTSFSGTVAGMTGNDTIDFTNLNPNTIQTPIFSGTSSGGALTVTDGSHTDHIALLGNYLASTFVASSDGHGGTSVVDPPAAAANQTALLGVQLHA